VSYTPSYTSLGAVSAILRVDFTNTSIPTQTEVMSFIKNAEYDVVQRRLGSHTATDEYIDVGGSTNYSSQQEWAYNVREGSLNFDMGGGQIVVLNNIKTPVISITTLSKNDADPRSAPSWEALTQWNGTVADSHYMLLKGGDKSLGYALWVYDEEPLPGPKRLKMTYTYGRNVDNVILGEYCTYSAAIRVLMARMGSNEPDGLSMLEGGDLGSFVTRQYTERIAQYRYEMLRIEAEHFPRDQELGMEVI